MSGIGFLKRFIAVVLVMTCGLSVINAQAQVIVNVEQPGMLQELLGQEAMSVQSVKVYGTLGKNDMAYLKEMTYSGCLSDIDLSESTLPDNTIPSYAFYDEARGYNPQLNHIVIPASTQVIGDYAFKGCSLQEFVLPYKVMKLGVSAFEDCQECVIKSDLGNQGVFYASVVPYRCFKGCMMVDIRYLSGSNQAVYEAECFKGVTFKGHDPVGMHIKGAIEIAEEAFADVCVEAVEGDFNSTDIGRDIIIEGSPQIGARAFAGVDVRYLTVDVPHIPDGFVAGSTLSDVYMKSVPETIGDDAFNNGKFSGERLSFDAGLKQIGARAYYMSSYPVISLPYTLQSLGEGSLYTRDEVKKVYCYAVEPPVANGAFNQTMVSNAELLVPEQSVDAYKTADGWRDFGVIRKMPGYGSLQSVEHVWDAIVLTRSGKICVETDMHDYDVSVVSINGVLMTKAESQNGACELDTSALPSGLYIVVLTSTNGCKSIHRVLIAH